MKKLIKILCLILSMILLLSATACGEEEESPSADAPLVIPDRVNYLDSGKQFDYYTYRSINRSSFSYYDGALYSVYEEFLTKERIQEYFESGMKLMCPQTSAQANGYSTPFEGSTLETLMDMCHELGYDESVVVTDTYIYLYPEDLIKNQRKNGDLLGITDWDKFSIIGDYEWQFADLQEFADFIEIQMRPYYFHPAFGGVFMDDEPSGEYMKVTGETYKAIKMAEKKLKAEKAERLGVSVDSIEDMYINMNLLPYYESIAQWYWPVEESFHEDEHQRNHEAYRRYIENYFKETGADFVQADLYPMKSNNVQEEYIVTLQIMAEEAKKNDAKLIIVTQANTDQNQRVMTREDMNYINNLTYGFGAMNIGYYAYTNLDDAGTFIYNDNGAMITRFGEKTAVYDIVKEANEVGQKLAPTILNFDYVSNKTYLCDNPRSNQIHMVCAENYIGKEDFTEFVKLVDFSINKESAIVTELYDSERENYMYMAFNSTDTFLRGSAAYQTAKLTFTSEYNKALVFFNGEYKIFDLDAQHSLTVKMASGEAHYIIPFAG